MVVNCLTVRTARMSSRLEKNREVMKSSRHMAENWPGGGKIAQCWAVLEVCGLGGKVGAVSRTWCFSPAVAGCTEAGPVLSES